MKRFYLLVLAVCCFLVVDAQSIKLKMANKLYDEFAYAKAINLYSELIKEEKDVQQATRMMASAYMKIGDYQNAEAQYSNLFGMDQYEPKAEEILNYAFALKSIEQYAKSDEWYAKYSKLRVGDSRATNHLDAGDYVKRYKETKDAYEVIPVPFNSERADFGPAFFGENLIFTSTRNQSLSIKRWHNWNGEPFSDIFVYRPNADSSAQVQLLNAESKGVNTRFHEGPACIDTLKNLIYFTRNNYSGKLQRSQKGVVHLQLYIAKREEGTWSNEISFPYNNPEYSIGHPALSADGNTLFFASDMEGGLGGVDIWMCKLNESGQWDKPENAGLGVNTEGDELFPSIDKNGVLYFASNGHVGLGGLDVFKAIQKDGKYQKAVNLGEPINSPFDDFGLIARPGKTDNEEGYFASNRTGGKGGDDIYYWQSLIRPLYVKGILTEKGSDTVLANAVITLKDTSGNKVSEVTTGADGSYSFLIERGKHYRLLGSKPNYFDNSTQVKADVPDLKTEILSNLTLEKDPGLSLYCLILDAKTNNPLEGVKFTLLDNMTGEEVASLVTPATGDYRKPLKDKKIGERLSYNIKIEKENYLAKTVTFNYEIQKEGEIRIHDELNLNLDPIEVGTDIGKLIDIQPIYYDYNKSNIRQDAALELDKIVKVMNENPALEIELGSHTDSRGSDAYNLKLSDKRAKSAAQYVKNRITNPERINGKGYGEKFISNRCINGVECSDEEHAENRRTEFKIIKM